MAGTFTVPSDSLTIFSFSPIARATRASPERVDSLMGLELTFTTSTRRVKTFFWVLPCLPRMS